MKFIDFGSESDFMRKGTNFRKEGTMVIKWSPTICGLSPPKISTSLGTNVASTPHSGPRCPGLQQEPTEKASCPQLDHRMTFCIRCVLNPAYI